MGWNFNDDLKIAYENCKSNAIAQRICNLGKIIEDTYNEVKLETGEDILVYLFSYEQKTRLEIAKYVMEKYSYKYLLLENIFENDSSKNYLIIFNKKKKFYAQLYEYLYNNNYRIYETDISDIISSVKWNGNYVGDLYFELLISNRNDERVTNQTKYLFYLQDKLGGIDSICYFWGRVLSTNTLGEYESGSINTRIGYGRKVIDYIKENNDIKNELEIFIALREYLMFPIQRYHEETKSILKKYKRNIEKIQSKKDEIYTRLIKKGTIKTKWKSEKMLFDLISNYFKDSIFQYNPSWLDRQSLDIFIPSLKVGFEYQGQQHFKSVDFFGGEETLEKNKMRDERKKKLCDENNVKLIYWNYDEPITMIALEEKLKENNVEWQ